MTETLQIVNPYEALYQEIKPCISKATSKQEAQMVVRHLGLLYNTFGIMMKDLIKIVAVKYEPQETSQQSDTEPFFKQRLKSHPEPGNVGIMNPYEEEVKVTKEKVNGVFHQNNLKKAARYQSRMKEQSCQKENDRDLDIDYDGDFAQKKKVRKSMFGNTQKSGSAKMKSSQDLKQLPLSFFSQKIKEDSPAKPQSPKVHEANQEPIVKPFHLSNRQRQSTDQEEFIIITEQQEYEQDAFKVDNQQIAQKSRGFKPKENEYTNIFNAKQSQLRVNPGRKKKDREQFMGIACRNCDRYYQSMDIKDNDICNCTSRHRSNLPMMRIPKNNFSQELDID